MIKNIEETQMDMYDKLDLLISGKTVSGTGSSDFSMLESKMINLERQIAAISSSVATISDTLLQLAGHQSGSKNLMDQVAQLNQIAHNKLSFLEENSINTHENTERLRSAFHEKETSSFWWYVCLVFLQLVIVIWLALSWKKGDGRNNDKKFI